MSFTGECTERPGSVVVSKHVSTHALSEMVNYVEKLQRIVYEQCYSSNLQVDHFFEHGTLKFAEIEVFRTYIGFRNCECWGACFCSAAGQRLDG